MPSHTSREERPNHAPTARVRPSTTKTMPKPISAVRWMTPALCRSRATPTASTTAARPTVPRRRPPER